MSAKADSAGAQQPVAGYDRLDARQLVASLSDRSQVELAEIDGYERSHQGRDVVLDKLRWLRGKEPLSGYDALGVDEILTTLQKADLKTIKRVRGYERKFGARREVLDEVVRLNHKRRAEQPDSPPTEGYRSIGESVEIPSRKPKR